MPENKTGLDACWLSFKLISVIYYVSQTSAESFDITRNNLYNGVYRWMNNTMFM